MKIFDGMQSFFESIVEYIKNFSNLFLIFLGAFALVSVAVIIITSFAYECKLTKTIDKINKFLERNPRINDDNLVAFNNLMKANSVPKTLRRQWQQFMLYREHPASYYMSFKHCVENPLRNSTYRQQMTVYRIITFVLIVLSLVVGSFMATNSMVTSVTMQETLIIPLTILVCYWLISMVLDLIHSAVSGDLFQNYQYFEINIDKAMLTLPEFVDYEVLFSQDEIRRGIPVLFAYLQKRAIQEQQELEKARLKSVDHEKFDFDEAGLDGSLVLDRAMRETENYTTQRKKYMQEIERVNNEIAVLENNYKEQTKEFQRQVQTSKETVENLKEQLEQAGSTIEINYIKKQMRDEINRQQMAEKEFDILTDKHNQEIKTLNQEIKRYDEETVKAKEAMEVAMLSEFNTYSIKVYDNLEKIVDEKMQDKVDEYKDQIKDLEIELEEKNEELENVYTRYQEVLSQSPVEAVEEEVVEEIPTKKSKKKKKSTSPTDEGLEQPKIDEGVEFVPEFNTYESENQDYSMDNQYTDYADNSFEQYDNNTDYGYEEQNYNAENFDEYAPQEEYVPVNDDYQQEEYIPVSDNFENYDYSQEEYTPANQEYVPLTDDYSGQEQYQPQEEYQTQEYQPQEYYQEEYVPQSEEYVPLVDGDNNEEYIPLYEENSDQTEYIPQSYVQEDVSDGEYVPLADYQQNEFGFEEPRDNEGSETETYSIKDDLFNDDAVEDEDKLFNDEDFDIDFSKLEPQEDSDNEDFSDAGFDFGFGEEPVEEQPEKEEFVEEYDENFDLNKALGLYDMDTDADVKPTENKIDLTKPVVLPETEDNAEEKVEVVKRKAGRPRKVVDETEVKPKRKVGRPKKSEVVETKVVETSHKRGRPRKTEKVNEKVTKEVAKRGRPRKVQTEVEKNTKIKAKRGRPRKQEAKTEVVVTKKRGRGRPRKSEKVKEKVTKTISKRGRPRKDASAKKQGAVDSKGILNKPKRKVGRPSKKAN